MNINYFLEVLLKLDIVSQTIIPSLQKLRQEDYAFEARTTQETSFKKQNIIYNDISERK